VTRHTFTNTAVAGCFAYDATEDSPRRTSVSPVLRSEDRELPAHKRRQLIASARDLPRNFAIGAWAVRKHLDYVSTFSFQSKTGDKKLDRRIEELMKWYAKPKNCDRAGRHSLARSIRMSEARRTLDGDIFHQKLRDGRLVHIEGDRVRNPVGGSSTFNVPRKHELDHGVVVDRHGEAKRYCVHRRVRGTGFEFERAIPSRYIVQHADYGNRFDATRGISVLAPALNPFRHCMEAWEFALAKAKISQMLGLVVKRANGEESLAEETTDADGSPTGEFEFSPGKAPFVLELEHDDEAGLIESATPSTQFQEFTSAMIAAALKALDIPYSFFDESFTNYSGQRQAWIQYDLSADVKRDAVRELLDEITAWRLGLFVLDGYLELPRKMTLANLSWDWIAAGVPWVDPLKEIKADREAIAEGLTSRQRITKQRKGVDWFDIQDELEAEDLRIAKRRAATAEAEEATNAA